MSNQENIKKLSELREQALEFIKQYNELAEQENYETRIGCIDATVNVYSIKENLIDDLDFEDDGESESDKAKIAEIENMEIDIRNYIKNSDRQPWLSVQMPGIQDYFWQASGLNC